MSAINVKYVLEDLVVKTTIAAPTVGALVQGAVDALVRVYTNPPDCLLVWVDATGDSVVLLTDAGVAEAALVSGGNLRVRLVPKLTTFRGAHVEAAACAPDSATTVTAPSSNIPPAARSAAAPGAAATGGSGGSGGSDASLLMLSQARVRFPRYVRGTIVEAPSSFIAGSGDWTFCAWFSPTEHTDCVLMGYDRCSDGEEQTRLQMVRDGHVIFVGFGVVNIPPATRPAHPDTNGYGSPLTSTTPLPLGKYTHVAVTRQGATVTLWINAAAHASVTLPSVHEVQGFHSRTIRLGCRQPRMGSEAYSAFPGTAYGGCIFDRALLGSELQRAMLEAAREEREASST